MSRLKTGSFFVFRLSNFNRMRNLVTLASLVSILFLAACQTEDDIVNGEIDVEVAGGETYVYGFDLFDNQSEVITIAAPMHTAESGIQRGSDNEIEFYYKADASYTGEDYAEFNVCDRSGSSRCRSSTIRIYFSIVL
jgi:hypothetical protein